MAAKYDRICDTYDTTRKPDPQVLAALGNHISLRLSGCYLNIGCGTGNYTAAVNRTGGRWTGLEPSAHMLDLAKKKDASIGWVQGSAEFLPFESEVFDGAMGTLAIHHFSDLGKAFREFDRVLRARGRLVIFTVTPEQARKFWLKRYFPEMMEKDAQLLPSISLIKAFL